MAINSRRRLDGWVERRKSSGESRAGGGIVQVELLSDHFLGRWAKRRGGCPSVESVNLMLCKGQILKRGQDLWKIVRGRIYPYQTLTQVWVHAENIILWIDERTATAVTVIVPRGSEKNDLTGLPRRWLVDRAQARPGGRR